MIPYDYLKNKLVYIIVDKILHKIFYEEIAHNRRR